MYISPVFGLNAIGCQLCAPPADGTTWKPRSPNLPRSSGPQTLRQGPRPIRFSIHSRAVIASNGATSLARFCNSSTARPIRSRAGGDSGDAGEDDTEGGDGRTEQKRLVDRLLLEQEGRGDARPDQHRREHQLEEPAARVFRVAQSRRHLNQRVSTEEVTQLDGDEGCEEQHERA